MDYKEKYEQALERAKMYQGMIFLPAESMIETIFPELKESEDERIRKEIIQFLQLPHPQFVGKRNHEEWIAWLEKQKDHENELEKAYKTADKVQYRKGFDDGVASVKPAEWSEEDEKTLNTVIEKGDLKPSEINWLKSLKERMNGE